MGNGTTINLNLIASLTLADHMGDAMNDVETVLEKLNIDLSDDPMGGEEGYYLKRTLHLMGVKTLNNTEIWDEDSEAQWQDDINN